MKKVILIGLVLLLFVGTANAAEITLDTLDYEQNKLITIPGNITMTPVEPDPITLLFRLYDPVSDITIYSVQSNEVEVDHTFVNDTKFFSFLANDNNTYLIGVDYSSIQVPPSIDEIKAEYEAIINELNARIERLGQELNAAREALNQSLEDLEIELGRTAPLLSRIENLTNDIVEYELNYIELSSDRNIYKQKYNEYKDSWNIFPKEGFYFNWPSFIIGIIVLIIIMNVLGNKSQGKPIPGWEGLKTVIFKQKPKVPYKEPTGSPRDLEELKKLKEGKK